MLSGLGVSPSLHCGGISIGSWQSRESGSESKSFYWKCTFSWHFLWAAAVNGVMPRSRSKVATRYGWIIIWHLIKWDKSSGVFWIIISYQLPAAAEGLLSFSPDSGIPAAADSRCINEQFWCHGAVACRHKNANILVMYSLLTKWLEPLNSFQVTSDIIELQLLKNNQIQNDISQLFTTSQQPVMAISVLIDNQ